MFAPRRLELQHPKERVKQQRENKKDKGYV
jgi:hypothetical protein